MDYSLTKVFAFLALVAAAAAQSYGGYGELPTGCYGNSEPIAYGGYGAYSGSSGYGAYGLGVYYPGYYCPECFVSSDCDDFEFCDAGLCQSCGKEGESCCFLELSANADTECVDGLFCPPGTDACTAVGQPPFIPIGVPPPPAPLPLATEVLPTPAPTEPLASEVLPLAPDTTVVFVTAPPTDAPVAPVAPATGLTCTTDADCFPVGGIFTICVAGNCNACGLFFGQPCCTNGQVAACPTGLVCGPDNTCALP